MKNHISFLQKVKKRVGPVLLAAATFLAAAGAAMPASAAQASAGTGTTAVIPVQQTMEGGSGTFSYVLTPEEQDAPMPEGSQGGSYTLTLTDTQESEIDIPCTHPGTWYYALEMQKSSDTNYSYGVTKYRIGVQCVNKGDGTYGTDITALADGASQDRKAKAVQFAVTYTAAQPETPNPGTGDPSVTKYIRRTQRGTDGELVSPSGDVDFHFTIEPFEESDRNSYPMPEGSENGVKTLTVTVKQGDRSASGEFGDITFTEPGTYNYRVAEVQESEAGFIYDETVYRAEYVVTQQSGTNDLDVQRTLYRVSGTSGSEVTQGRDVATFSNEYNPSKASKTNVSRGSGSGGGSTPSRTSTSSTGSGKGSAKSGRVKTGDTARIGLYFGMLAGAAALLIILGAARRKRDAK